MDDRSERELLDGLRRGENEAYSKLVRDNTGRLLVLARGILRNPDDANEAVQEAFMQAFRAMDRFEGNARLSTWLHRITVNTCLLRLRHAKTRPESSIEDLLPRFDETGHRYKSAEDAWSEGTLEKLERHQIGKVVRGAIDRLPDRFRDVVLLRDIEGLTTEETAKVLGIRPEAAKMRLHRARQALRTLLELQMQSEAIA